MKGTPGMHPVTFLSGVWCGCFKASQTWIWSLAPPLGMMGLGPVVRLNRLYLRFGLMALFLGPADCGGWCHGGGSAFRGRSYLWPVLGFAFRGLGSTVISLSWFVLGCDPL